MPLTNLKQPTWPSVKAPVFYYGKVSTAQQDMQRALKTFPALKDEAEALASLYPMGLEGCHRLHFDNIQPLDLWIGDVHELL